MGLLGDISPEASVAIGIVVGLLSTSIQSLGLTLQRQSHLFEDAKVVPETRKPPYKRPRWQLGMLMFVVSNLVGSTIQITTLPLPVLSALQASGLVFNTAFATLLLKEPFTRYSLVGTVLTCVGAALIAIFGAVAEPAHSLRQLLDLLAQKGFIVWMVGTLLVAAGTLVFSHILKVYSIHKHTSHHAIGRSRSSSKVDLPATARSRTQSFSAQLPRPLQLKMIRLRLVRGLSYALISGILSAHSLLVAKSAVELIVRTIVDHDNQFNSFQSWLILVALVFFALSQLYYLHLGLRLCSTSVLYPFVFCIYNIVAILDGLIYFRQASRLTALHGGLVAVGTVILLSGVLALSWRLDDTAPTEAAPQVIAAQTPLAPGMGTFRNSDELERSPLSFSFGRANTLPSQGSDERAPLLTRPGRRTTLTKSGLSPGGAAAREIWAELDDDEDTFDFLASLPRSSSPLLSSKTSLQLPKKNRRASLPSQNEEDGQKVQHNNGRRRVTLHEYSQAHAREAAARIVSPSLRPVNETTHGDTETSSETASVASSSRRKASRERKLTVRFEEDGSKHTSPKRSRWDAGGGNDDHDRDQQNRKNDPHGKTREDDHG